MIDLAMLENDGQFSSYYGHTRHISEHSTHEKLPPPLGGTTYKVKFDAESQVYQLKLKTNSENEAQGKMEKCLVEFFGGLQLQVEKYIKNTLLFSTHWRLG